MTGVSTVRSVYATVCARLPHWLFLLPAVAGVAWIITLSSLLIHWLASGRPTYPEQSNPYVPFISDIAAWHLKPLFVTGCVIVSITYTGTMVAVHYARQSLRFYGGGSDEPVWRKLASAVTLVAGVVAGTSLLLLSILDTARAHERHQVGLLSTFMGITVAAIGTGIVWGDVWIESKERNKQKGRGIDQWLGRLRIWCAINFGFMLVIAGLGVSFVALNILGDLKVAGILEWIVAFLGAFWLLTFIGFLIRMDKDDEKGAKQVEEEIENERQPLLDDV